MTFQTKCWKLWLTIFSGHSQIKFMKQGTMPWSWMRRRIYLSKSWCPPASRLSKNTSISLYFNTSSSFFLFLFFNTADTRAATLFAILKDVLCHFRLTIGDCHEQCCDGATNMRRRYRTLRGLVQQEQQLALYIRCMACMSLTWCCRARVRSGNMLRFLGRDVWKQLCYVLSEA